MYGPVNELTLNCKMSCGNIKFDKSKWLLERNNLQWVIFKTCKTHPSMYIKLWVYYLHVPVWHKHIFYAEVFNPGTRDPLYCMQHTWFKWSAHYQGLLKPGNDLLPWVRCVLAGWYAKLAGQWAPRTWAEDLRLLQDKNKTIKLVRSSPSNHFERYELAT